MSDKQITAVEWYIKESDRYFIYYKTNRISYNDLQINLKELKGIAKSMEKEQIIEAHAVGRIKEVSQINTDGYEYYKENYEQ